LIERSHCGLGRYFDIQKALNRIGGKKKV